MPKKRRRAKPKAKRPVGRPPKPKPKVTPKPKPRKPPRRSGRKFTRRKFAPRMNAEDKRRQAMEWPFITIPEAAEIAGLRPRALSAQISRNAANIRQRLLCRKISNAERSPWLIHRRAFETWRLEVMAERGEKPRSTKPRPIKPKGNPSAALRQIIESPVESPVEEPKPNSEVSVVNDHLRGMLRPPK